MSTCPPLLLLALLAGVPAVPLVAQERPSPEVLLEQKLASPFLENAAWRRDFDAACAEAHAQQMLIFGYFTTAGP